MKEEMEIIAKIIKEEIYSILTKKQKDPTYFEAIANIINEIKEDLVSIFFSNAKNLKII